MDQCIAWHPEVAGTPAITHAKGLSEIRGCAVLAGQRGESIVIDEFSSSDSYGDEHVRIFDSTTLPEKGKDPCKPASKSIRK
jgi:hypothetical protein